MATVYYSIYGNTSSGGSPWKGQFIVTSTSSVISSSLPSLISVDSPSLSFTPGNFSYYSGEYVTWRTYIGASQYPINGYSFDIWSADLYTRASVGSTWNDVITFNSGSGAGIYSLDSQKWTLIYNYDIPQAPKYGKSGYIQFSLSPL